MASVASLLFGIAVLLVAMAGFTAILQLETLAQSLVKFAVYATLGALFINYTSANFTNYMGDFASYGFNFGAPSSLGIGAMPWLVVLGHLGLGGAWVYARVGPPAFIENIERARGRGRERVAPAIEPETGDE